MSPNAQAWQGVRLGLTCCQACIMLAETLVCFNVFVLVGFLRIAAVF